jgi:hypothetical protein
MREERSAGTKYYCKAVIIAAKYGVPIARKFILIVFSTDILRLQRIKTVNLTILIPRSKSYQQ